MRTSLLTLVAVAPLAIAQTTPVPQAYLKISPLALEASSGSNFGTAVAADRNLIAVGAPREDGGGIGVNGLHPVNGWDSGAVTVFQRSGTAWSPAVFLKASNTGSQDQFGTSVDLSGNTLVVGAPGEDSAPGGPPFQDDLAESGAAYVFVRDPVSGTWSQQGFLKADDSVTWMEFGRSVAIDGDRIVIGAPGANNYAGAAYVFHRAGGTWTQEAKLLPANPDFSDQFGRSVDMSGDSVIVGAPYEQSGTTVVNGPYSNTQYSAGGAYVFARNTTTGVWSQQAFLKPPNTQSGDDFGSAVAIDGDAAVVGAPREWSGATGVNGNFSDESQQLAGAAYVFRRTAGSWAHEAYLKASNTQTEDRFGGAVEVEGDTILVGAAREDSNATGVNGDQANNAISGSGAVYRFTRTAGVWSGNAYLKASNPGEDDHFGAAMDYSGYYALNGEGIALSGGTAVIGAAREDSAARGVGGNQADETGSDMGAAYVFDQVSTPVPQLAVEHPEHVDLINGAAAINFGLALTGGDAEREIVLRNLGGGNLTGLVCTFSGPGATDFQVSAALSSPVAPSTSQALRIRFAPTTTGSKLATLQINSNDPTSPSFKIVLSGQAVSTDETVTTTGNFRVRQDGYIKASNTDARDFFGGAVAISGNTMVISAAGEDSSSTTISHSPVADAAQKTNDREDSGAAYVFVRNPGTGAWSQQACLKATGAGAGDTFGSRVAIHGDIIAVAAWGEDGGSPGVNGPVNDDVNNAGAVYIFTRSGVTWTQQAYLKSEFPDTESLGFNRLYGIGLTVHGDTVAVGSIRESAPIITGGGPDTVSFAGTVYIYRQSGGTWTQEARLTDPNALPYDSFGRSVSLWQDTLVVGSLRDGYREDLVQHVQESSGCAFVFRRSGTVWTQEAKLEAHGPFWNDQFGSAVAINGDSLEGETIVIGAPGEDGIHEGVLETSPIGVPKGLERCGAAYVFRKGSGSNWIFDAYLKPTNALLGWYNDYHNDDLSFHDKGLLYFGSSVAISGNTILVGASEESSGGIGVNPSSSGAQKRLSGAAYSYERDNAGHWSAGALLKASNAETGDSFGHSVAIDGRIGIVTAPGEDSNARGIGGNAADNNAVGAGAAYLFGGLTPQAEIEVSRAPGAVALASGATVDFGSVPTGRERVIQFTIANTGDRNLTFLPNPLPDISLTGDTASFSITTSPADPVAPGESTTFTIRFAPATDGPHLATALIASNDQNEATYTLLLSAQTPAAGVDADGDGVPDADEFDLESLGFRAGQNDSALVATLHENAEDFDLYDEDGLRALMVDTPLIFRDPGTNTVTLTLGVRKSDNLTTFDPFPATPPQVTVNPSGEIEFTFPSPDPRAFFRIEAE